MNSLTGIDGLVTPKKPVQVALIGTGHRSSTVYAPLFSVIKPWLKVVAVCDPLREHADAMAKRLEVPPFYDIHKLVEAKPMEAGLVVAPVPLHHSISVYLSSHGVHNLVETSWCSLIAQARQMIQVARENGAVVRVAENFFRHPIDRIVQKLKETGFIGKVWRIMCYNDLTGYHNNSRWIAFAREHPVSVWSLEHTMPTAPFHSTPQRFHEDETYTARFFEFPEGLFVVDHRSNGKGLLGRHPRPGYTEWQGERGTVVYAAEKAWEGRGEVRHCSDEALATGGGQHDQTFPIVEEREDGQWIRTYVDLPIGCIEYVDPFQDTMPKPSGYHVSVVDHMVDFALAVRGLRQSEFDEEDAMMSLMMDVGAQESAFNDGAQISLPLEGDVEADSIRRVELRDQFGVDPMDVEGMLAISHPRP